MHGPESHLRVSGTTEYTCSAWHIAVTMQEVHLKDVRSGPRMRSAWRMLHVLEDWEEEGLYSGGVCLVA
jgi:hypothetical protein